MMNAARQMFYRVKHKQAWGFDQTVLSKFIWPLAVNDSVLRNQSNFCTLIIQLISSSSVGKPR